MKELESNLSKSLSKVLEVEREEVIREASDKGITVIDQKKVDDQLEEDYQRTRNRINGMMDRTSAAFESAISLAVSSESPRAIEALSTLMKSMSDLNSSLLDTHIKMKKLKEETETKKEEAGTTNNNTFVFNGTTSELKEYLQNLKK